MPLATFCIWQVTPGELDRPAPPYSIQKSHISGREHTRSCPPVCVRPMSDKRPPAPATSSARPWRCMRGAWPRRSVTGSGDARPRPQVATSTPIRRRFRASDSASPGPTCRKPRDCSQSGDSRKVSRSCGSDRRPRAPLGRVFEGSRQFGAVAYMDGRHLWSCVYVWLFAEAKGQVAKYKKWRSGPRCGAKHSASCTHYATP